MDISSDKQEEKTLTGLRKRNLKKPYEQVVYAQTRICPVEWEAQTSLEFWDTNG